LSTLTQELAAHLLT